MLEAYDKFIKQIEESGKNYDVSKISEAYNLAEKAHSEQTRRTGEPYITHPLAVASILVDLGMDTESIVAALLHDVVEDTTVTLEEIEKQFGASVALMVDGVTKVGRIPLSSRETQQAENIRKMLLAMAKDIRVVIIKLADRLHNMRTISYMTEQKQRDTSLETMEVYAPIAHRLGIKAIKEELEDLSLRVLDNVAYHEIEEHLEMRKEEREVFLEVIKAKISQRLDDENHNYIIQARIKSIYGIYRKVYMQGKSIDDIYDIYAIRVIVDNDNECYNVLGIVHDMFTPLPNRFKDYISTPKKNMYQSLHTVVIDKEPIPFEIQIRTKDMHYTAEYGIAAHWKYKAGVQGQDNLEARISWVRQLLEEQQDSDDVEDLVQSIKSDIAPEEVFVFTPKGDVKRLPTGSNVIDFAYAIHSGVGDRMIGAKVGGRIVPFDFEVQTGMIVEILTTNSPEHGPSRDWLKMVKTSEARNKIRAWYKKEKREENVETGRDDLERELKRNYINLTGADLEEFIADLARRQHYNTVEDFFAAIGYGGISLSKIMPRVKDEYIRARQAEMPDFVPKKKPAPSNNKDSSGVIVEGLDGCLVKFSKCCNPLPGDNIIGFITRGYGVSIHKQDCENVTVAKNSPEQKDRLVNTEWASSANNETFKTTLEIYTSGRSGIFAEINIMLDNMHIPISALNARELKEGGNLIVITVRISDLTHLHNIQQNLKKIGGVFSVERSKG